MCCIHRPSGGPRSGGQVPAVRRRGLVVQRREGPQSGIGVYGFSMSVCVGSSSELDPLERVERVRVCRVWRERGPERAAVRETRGDHYTISAGGRYTTIYIYPETRFRYLGQQLPAPTN